MEYVLYKNEEIKEGPKPLPKSWDHISGFNNLSKKELAEYGWYPWKKLQPPGFDSRTHRLLLEVKLKRGVVSPHYKLEELSEDEKFHALAESKRECQSALGSLRWDKENTGEVTVSGVGFKTDMDTYQRVLAAAEIEDDQLWKIRAGFWITVTQDQLKTAAEKIREHRKKCFAHEAWLSKKVKKALSTNELDEIDLEEGWPLNLE